MRPDENDDVCSSEFQSQKRKVNNSTRELAKDQPINVVDYDQRFLEKSWIWLQDEETRSLTMTPSFSREEQLLWYKSLPSKEDYVIRGVLMGNTPIGAFGIKNISEGSGEYWGYIGEKSLWGLGIGNQLMQQAFDLARRLNLRHLYLKVPKGNSRALRLYEKHGFTRYREDDKVIWMECNL